MNENNHPPGDDQNDDESHVIPKRVNPMASSTLLSMRADALAPRISATVEPIRDDLPDDYVPPELLDNSLVSAQIEEQPQSEQLIETLRPNLKKGSLGRGKPRRKSHKIPEHELLLVCSLGAMIPHASQLRALQFRCLQATPALDDVDDDYIFDTIGGWAGFMRHKPPIADLDKRHAVHAFFQRARQSIPFKLNDARNRHLRLLAECVIDWEKAIARQLQNNPQWLMTDEQLQLDPKSVEIPDGIQRFVARLPIKKERSRATQEKALRPDQHSSDLAALETGESLPEQPTTPTTGVKGAVGAFLKSALGRLKTAL